MKLLKWFTLYILLLFTTNSWGQQAKYLHPADSAALHKLLVATNANNWNTGANLSLGTPWIAAVSPVLWHGIDTIQDPIDTLYYRVSKIDLDGDKFTPTGTSYLTDTLPAGLFDNFALFYLDTLILTGNQLTAVAALGLKNTNSPTASPCPNLRYLGISQNKINPTDNNFFFNLIGNLDSLNVLEAENCMDSIQTGLALGFSGYTLPVNSSLERLNISDNKFQLTLNLDDLTIAFPNLLKLYANNNNFIGLIAASNTTNKPLYVLSMRNNDLEGFVDIKNLLINYDALEYLYGSSIMNELIVSDSLDLAIANRPNMLWLELPNNNFSKKIPIELFEVFPNIETIRLQGNELEGRLPTPLAASTLTLGTFSVQSYGGLERLKDFNLADNNLEGNLHLEWILSKQMAANIGNPNSNGLLMQFNYLNIANNNFGEIRPRLEKPLVAVILGNLLSNRFRNVKELDVSGNAFDFKDLYRLTRIFRMYRYADLGGTLHYVPQSGIDTTDFRYNYQDSIGIGGVKRRNQGDSLLIKAGRGTTEDIVGSSVPVALCNIYSWERVDPQAIINPLGVVLDNGTYSGVTGGNYQPGGVSGGVIPDVNRHELGIAGVDSITHGDQRYVACVTNDSFPLLTLCMKQKKVEVGECVDASGNPIQCQTMIVQFKSSAFAGLTAAQKDSVKTAVREEMGAEPIESCLCGDIELWGVSDTAMVEGFGSGTKKSTTSTRSRAELQSADPNYALLSDTTNNLPDSLGIVAGQGNTTAKTIVAVIDAGIDYNYQDLRPFISEGPADGDTCMSDAVWGYNFLENNNNATDDHGHGTAIAGVVAGLSKQNLIPNTSAHSRDIAILPLKYTDAKGQGSLFHATCALYYAADYKRVLPNNDTAKVKVINCSWGYYGDPCIVVENGLAYVAEQCDILVVASAGNKGNTVQGDSSNWHWPSNSISDEVTYNSDNILAVTAIATHSSDSLDASYANFGNVKIDMAAQGRDSSTQAGSNGAYGPVKGTSFAAAQVSRAAALLFDKYPTAKNAAVKYALMEGTDRLQSGSSADIKSGGRLNYIKADSILNLVMNKEVCSVDAIQLVPLLQIANEEYNIAIYPNPVMDKLNIDMDYELTDKGVVAALYNIQGQLLHQEDITTGGTNTTINTAQLPAGVYFLRLQIGAEQITQKFVKI